MRRAKPWIRVIGVDSGGRPLLRAADDRAQFQTERERQHGHDLSEQRRVLLGDAAIVDGRESSGQRPSHRENQVRSGRLSC
jgi:hypothetical protein